MDRIWASRERSTRDGSRPIGLTYVHMADLADVLLDSSTDNKLFAQKIRELRLSARFVPVFR